MVYIFSYYSVLFILFIFFAIFIGYYLYEFIGAILMLIGTLICSYFFNRKYNLLLLTNKEFHKITNRAILKRILSEFEEPYSDKKDINYLLMLFFEN